MQAHRSARFRSSCRYLDLTGNPDVDFSTFLHLALDFQDPDRLMSLEGRFWSRSSFFLDEISLELLIASLLMEYPCNSLAI